MKIAEATDNAASHGIEMDIPDQLQKIWFFLADDGSVPVLEKMTDAVMPKVETDGVTGKKAAHEEGELVLFRTQQQVKMIGHQTPREAGGLRLEKEFGEMLEEASTVLVIEEDIALLDSPHHNVLQKANEIKSS